MLTDPRSLRLVSTAGTLAVLIAWPAAAVMGGVRVVPLLAVGLGALCAGHVLMHALSAVPAAVVTGLLGLACVGAAVSGRLSGTSPGAWLGMLAVSSWIVWTCVGPRRTDDRRRAAQAG